MNTDLVKQQFFLLFSIVIYFEKSLSKGGLQITNRGRIVLQKQWIGSDMIQRILWKDDWQGVSCEPN